MEFNEKIQELRKSRGLTQEELADILFVSRAAVSKWESGRGYPSIDSLKDISRFFSVSVDDLLSGEKLILIAEKESKSKIKDIFDYLFGIADLFSVMLIVLPLYPNEIDGYILSVPLFDYIQISRFNLIIYWSIFITMTAVGLIRLILIRFNKSNDILMYFSLSVNIIAVLFLALTREAYAAVIAFLILILKALIFYRRIKFK